MPHYPRESLTRRTQGVAVVALEVGTDGQVENAHVLQAPDFPIAEAVTSAARQWAFEPVRMIRGGRPVPAKVETKLTFYFAIGAEGVGRVMDPLENIVNMARGDPAAGSAAIRAGSETDGAEGAVGPGSTRARQLPDGRR